MSPPTATDRKHIVPVRACARCDVIDDVFHLTIVGRAWLCRACHRGLRYPEGRAARADDGPSVDARLRRIDGALRWGGIAARIVGYVAFLAFAHRYPIAQNLLLGVFAADAFGWVLHAWWDARFHGKAVTVEAVLYTILYIAMDAGGLFDLPLDVPSRFLAGGAAALTLGAWWLRFWCALRIAPA